MNFVETKKSGLARVRKEQKERRQTVDFFFSSRAMK